MEMNPIGYPQEKSKMGGMTDENRVVNLVLTIPYDGKNEQKMADIFPQNMEISQLYCEVRVDGKVITEEDIREHMTIDIVFGANKNPLSSVGFSIWALQTMIKNNAVRNFRVSSGTSFTLTIEHEKNATAAVAKWREGGQIEVEFGFIGHLINE